MASDNAVDLESLFEQAIEIESTDELNAFTDHHCATRPELRLQLEAMLKSHREAGSFLERPLESKSTMSHSVLALLGDKLGDWPRVLLKTTDDDQVVRLSVPDFPQPRSQGRYQLHGELARGGMGVILRARDVDLGRDLALKVLLDDHKDKPEYLQRFIEEAQISGQLVHPGIAPVYELGQLEDERPFFSMKLVRGRTLASLLGDRENADIESTFDQTVSELPRLLAVFEQVCQTMAYAHSRGVIHRDLKPANIMVGAFGEVQVMDWGLAKVISEGGVADEKKASERIHRENSIKTLRSSDPSGSNGSDMDTRLGSVMGTLAYIAPEQASGEVDHLDERADVFALGAILCEILTGHPPYVAEDSVELHRMAAQGDLDQCHSRLQAAKAEEGLVQLARSCLEVDRRSRPKNAAAVVRAFTAYESKLRERVKQAELDMAVSETKTREERRRHRLYKLLAAALLLLLIGAASAALRFRSLSEANEELAKSAGKQATSAKINFIASKAQEILGQESEEAVLLALAAVRLSQQVDGGEPSLRTREALLNATQRLVGRPLRGHKGRIQELILGDRHVVALCKGLVYVWEIQDKGMIGQPVCFGDQVDPVLDIATNEARTTILIASSKLLRWDTRFPIRDSQTVATGIDGSSIGISGNGRWAVARTIRGALCRWDLEADGERKDDLATQATSCKQVEVSYDGSWVAIRRDRTEVELFDLRGELPQSSLMTHENSVSDISLGRTGRWLACCRNKLHVYDLSAASIVASLRTLNHHPWAANRVKLARDEETLFAWCNTWGTLTKCDLRESTEGLEAKTVEGDENSVNSAAFPRDTNVLLTAGGGGELRVHNFTTGAYGLWARRSKLHDWPIHCIELEPSGRWLASAAWDGTLRLWDMASDDPRSSPLVLRMRPGNVTGKAAISPDGQWIAQPTDRNVAVWNTNKPYSMPQLLWGPDTQQRDETADSAPIRAQFGDGVLLTTKSGKGVHLWDFTTGKDKRVTGRALDDVEDAIITQKSGKLLFHGPDLTLHLCDVKSILRSPESNSPFDSAKPIGRYEFPPSVHHLGPNDRWLVSVCRRRRLSEGVADGESFEVKLYVWDLLAKDVKKSLKQLDAGEQFIWNENGVDITRTGRWLVTGGGKSEGTYSETVRIWDLHDLSKPPKIIEQTGDVWEIEMHDSGRWLYVNRHIGKPELRDLTTSQVYYIDEGFQHGRMSPDGRWLACSGRTHYNAYVYDLKTEEPLKNAMVLRGHEAPIWNVAFSDDSKWLVTSSSDGTTRRWSMDNDWLVDFAKTMVGRDLSLRERDEYGLTDD